MTPRLPMSPKARSSLVNVTAFIGAVVAVAGLTGGAIRLGDAHYVRADTFTVYQQGQRENRTVDSLKHDRELADIRRDFDEVKASQLRMDSSVACLRHHKPSWCE